MGFLQYQEYSSEVIVVENGSSDRTLEVARAAAQQYEQLKALHEAVAGKGRAVRRGMLAARGSFRFICDADLSMPIEELNRFLPPLSEDYDIAIASREVEGAIRYGEPAYRHWIGRAFNLLVRIIAVPEFQDTQCGFKCFKAEAAEALFPLQRLPGWTFDVELLFIAQRRGYKVIELPIPWYYNPGSRVRLMRDSIRMFSDLFRIRRNWSAGRYSADQSEFERV
jgi:glycosyltransferase involved in cell wall biosynthesis